MAVSTVSPCDATAGCRCARVADGRHAESVPLAKAAASPPATGERAISKALLVSAIVLNLCVGGALLVGWHSHVLTALWLASLAMLVLAVPGEPPPPAGERRLELPIVAGFVICLPALVRCSNFQMNRAHGDDFLTGYFSATYDLRSNFFAPVPANGTQWVTQFPCPFFLFQKIFFLLFGENLMSIKFSVLPYVVVVSVFLFLVTRELLNERAAIVAVVLYAFFWPSLYLETLGLHFVSSTAAFLAFFYVTLRQFRTGSQRLAVVSGILAGACCLFYTSSLIALPILTVFMVVRCATQGRQAALRSSVLASAAALAIVAPFVVQSLFSEPNYFLRRIDQVSLLTGEWSDAAHRIAAGENPAKIVAENFNLSVRSLYGNGLSGHGGYDFGHRALFDRLSLALFVLGSGIGFVHMRRHPEWLMVYTVVLVSFFAGMVLTIPPPAFHRFSVSFPFVTIFLVLPLDWLMSQERWGAFRHGALALALGAFVASNLLSFRAATRGESNYEGLRLARLINRDFPDRDVYVAAFPSFGFEKCYYFAPGKKARRVVTDYHKAFLEAFNPDEKYVYVITIPKDFEEKFARLDPLGRIIHFSPNYSLLVN
jgi:dolichyl-phosphate-mannose-protein mannosyltransferase